MYAEGIIIVMFNPHVSRDDVLRSHALPDTFSFDTHTSPRACIFLQTIVRSQERMDDKIIIIIIMVYSP